MMKSTTSSISTGVLALLSLLSVGQVAADIRTPAPGSIGRDSASPLSALSLEEGVTSVIVDGKSFDESTFVLNDVPQGQRVHCTMFGDGNVNMIGRYGGTPSNLNYDCIGYIAGTSNEGCGFYAAKEDTSVYITTYAFSPFDQLEITCTFVEAQMLSNGEGLAEQSSDLPGLTHFYKMEKTVFAGENVSCTLLGANGDANLYVRYNSDPEIFSRTGDGFDCQSRLKGSDEACELQGPAEDSELYVAVDTMVNYTDVTITCASPIGFISEGRGVGCFSADTTVTVQHKGTVDMKDLQVGDAVLTSSSSYETVYAFGHFHKTLPMEYLQFTFQKHNKQPLQVTGNHLLYVKGSGDQPVRADTVKVGDLLLVGQDDSDVADADVEARVTKITPVTKAGAYLPLTASGNIVVNQGIVASTYVSIAEEVAPKMIPQFISQVMSEQTLLHVWLTPTRMLCNTFDCQATSPSSNKENGILAWLQAGLALLEFGEQQALPVQLLGLIIGLAVLAVFALLEWVLMGSGYVRMMVLTGVVAHMAWKQHQNFRTQVKKID